MLDVRDADPRRVAHPIVYSRRRSPQVEWPDVTQQQPLDQPQRQSPGVQHPPSTIQANAEINHGAGVAGQEAAGFDSSTMPFKDAGPVSSATQTDYVDETGDAGYYEGDDGYYEGDDGCYEGDDGYHEGDDGYHEGAGDAYGQEAVGETEAAVGAQVSEDKLDAQAETLPVDTSTVVVDAHITIPLLAPTEVPDAVASSGGSDTGGGKAPLPSSDADSQEDLVHKGLVDFFSKLAVDWSKKSGQSTASTEPASALPGVDAALEVLRKLILDFIKLYRRLVRRFEDQTQSLADWAEDTTLDALWADMAKSFFCERSMGEEGFRDGAIMVSSCQQALQNAISRAQENSKCNGTDYRIECRIRVAKKCIVCCDGIVELAKRAERERIACQHLIHELKDARDLLNKWMGKSRLLSREDGSTDEQTRSRKQSR